MICQRLQQLRSVVPLVAPQHSQLRRGLVALSHVRDDHGTFLPHFRFFYCSRGNRIANFKPKLLKLRFFTKSCESINYVKQQGRNYFTVLKYTYKYMYFILNRKLVLRFFQPCARYFFCKFFFNLNFDIFSVRIPNKYF